jgi:hypothetical protein
MLSHEVNSKQELWPKQLYHMSFRSIFTLLNDPVNLKTGFALGQPTSLSHLPTTGFIGLRRQEAMTLGLATFGFGLSRRLLP